MAFLLIKIGGKIAMLIFKWYWKGPYTLSHHMCTEGSETKGNES